MGRKMSRRLSWQIWADFGQARDAQNGGKMVERAKMGRRRRQDDAPRWGLSGHLEVDWGLILSILGGLGGDLCRNGRSIKMSIALAFWLHFRVLGGLAGGSWRLSWGILARSWAILCDLGVKLGPCWQDVGTKMAKMSQDRRTWGENGWLEATRDGKGRCGMVRDGRCS